jgi:hypothetical protein
MRFIFTCPKCKLSEFHPNIEKTLEYYSELYEIGTEPVTMLNQDPPFRPDDIIMVCENKECNHTEKYTTLQMAEALRDLFSDYVWAGRKKTRPDNLFYLEDILVQHFLNNEDISVEDLKENVYLRSLYYKAHGNS